jgi:hypothetical protein
MNEEIPKELSKPITQVIDALLGPKIEKLSQWSKNREIGSFLKNDKLKSLLEAYLERTIGRCVSISTIVFPLLEMPLPSIYEPLKLMVSHNGFEGLSDDMETVIDIDGSGRCYLIVDAAGMGKSTFSKNLCLEVTAKSDKIPIYFELSQYSPDKTLIDNLAFQFDDIDKIFNRDLFNQLITLGKFFIVLDGFDEVPRDAQQKLGRELKNLNEKKCKSSLVVTSRPQEQFPSLVEAVLLNLQPLNIEQVKSILSRYDSISGSPMGEMLINEIEKVPGRFLETPLLVGLLYKTYGYNQSIADKITVFYSEIFNALYKGHDLTKSGYVREKTSGLDIDRFKQLLSAFSLIYIAKSSVVTNDYDAFLSMIEEAKNLCNLETITPRDFLNDLLLAVPLLTRDGVTLKFMHRTIAEYFAAEYVVNNGDKKNLLKKIVDSPMSNRFKQVVDYIYELDPVLSREIISKPIAINFLSNSNNYDFDPHFATLSFTARHYISVWEYEKVVIKTKDNRIEMQIPRPEKIGESEQFSHSSYMYGNVSKIHYVAAISSFGDINLPLGTVIDLIDIKYGEGSGFNYLSSESDSNLIELTSHLETGKWYGIDSDEVRNIVKLASIQELFGRNNMLNLRNLEKSNYTDESMMGFTMIISAEKCRSLIESVENIIRAETSISELLSV